MFWVVVDLVIVYGKRSRLFREISAELNNIEILTTSRVTKEVHVERDARRRRDLTSIFLIPAMVRVTAFSNSATTDAD